MIEPRPRKRCKRLNSPGDAHCLTFSCYQRLPLLRSPTLCSWLAEAIEAARAQHSFDLWGYVFMPQHVHVLLWPRENEYSISRILTAIKRPVAYKAIGQLKAKGHPLLRTLAVTDRSRAQYRLWQAGGGHDRNLRDPKAIHAALAYVHGNPVRRGLVESPVDWVWSSARDWHDLDGSPLRVDRTLPLLMT